MSNVIHDNVHFDSRRRPRFGRCLPRLFPALLLLAGGFSALCFAQEAERTESSRPSAVLFRFRYAPGDQSRILSTVEEEIFVNGTLSHRAEIINRIFCKVSDVDSDGTATLEATFMTSEHATGAYDGFSWGEEYRSVFRRAPTGEYEIDRSCFMPTVRNVPVFPETPLKIGDTWTAEGHEAHDMRRTFGIEEPFIVPFVASYRYAGDEVDEESGRTFNVVEASYSMAFQSPAMPSAARSKSLDLPAYTMGMSEQTIWWDNERGMIDHYSERFRIAIETGGGDTIRFQGTARAEVAEWERFRTDKNRRRLSKSVENLGLENVAVTETERGLAISIENIQFLPDSTELMESAKAELRRISRILMAVPNDLLITGHCADRGTKESQQRISEERAAAVAEYLISQGVRAPQCVFTQGKGASEPLSSNDTEAGRARNRRVEITIMDE